MRPEIRPEAELRSDSSQRPRWRTTRTFESRGIGETAAGEEEVAVTYAVAGRDVRPRRSVATYWKESGPEYPAAGVYVAAAWRPSAPGASAAVPGAAHA